MLVAQGCGKLADHIRGELQGGRVAHHIPGRLAQHFLRGLGKDANRALGGFLDNGKKIGLLGHLWGLSCGVCGLDANTPRNIYQKPIAVKR